MNKEKPKVKPGDWITIGKGGILGKHAVVCQVYDDEENADLEVVYLDGSRAINEDVVWKDNQWEFEREGPAGGYADNYLRLTEFVVILRRGRYWK